MFISVSVLRSFCAGNPISARIEDIKFSPGKFAFKAPDTLNSLPPTI